MVEFNSPELLDIFTKIVIENKKYCYLCLRSEDERRLVVPKACQKFVAAVKAKKNSPILFVCHICEKQAANALKLLQATNFASTLSLILNGLKNRDLQSNRIIFNKRFYNKILKTNGLSETLTPVNVYKELQCVRKCSGLVETETLIMDSKHVFEAASVSETTQSDQQIFQDAIIECPIRPVETTTPVIFPEPTAGENMHSNTPTETCIVIDDDDSLKDPSNIPQTKDPQPAPTKPLSVIPTALLMPPPILNKSLVLTLNPPQIITFEELMQQPQPPNVNFILHPIFLDVSGNFCVPSLSAIIINGNLIIYEAHIIRSKRSLGVNMDIVRQSLLSNNEVFIQNLDLNNPVNASGQTEESCKPKKKKTDGRNDDVLEQVTNQNGSFCVKRRNAQGTTYMKTIKISDISSGVGALTTDNTKNLVDKTDWEDKIPMDVISFVDAVDPNASSVLSRMQNLTSLPSQEAVPLPTPVSLFSMQVGAARSFKNPIEAEIIDLC